ncbi:LOG family protein [Sphingomonas crocodyli]|uniref:AMP nucleosidase n=1 Tax=Sphingomonas crocodyli TaxID=1979270 RepID=A0A437M734_9SPHN|nr:LOG family protein [Sphingomonas crocodyli]RVT93459.1 LOG family protein [Sphingomonas crocodyli]
MTNQFRRHDSPRARKPATAQAIDAGRASYLLAHRDPDFLERDELRALRFQLELLKPEMLLDDAKIDSTFVVFGSARSPANVPIDPAGNRRTPYEEARALARLASGTPVGDDGHRQFVVCSGAGPSIMEAANRGAADVGQTSIGLGIVLPWEEIPNPYVTPELSFQFHYFSLRKMHFLLRAKAVAVFPGGFGTLDELFDILTVMQTGKMPIVPVVLFDQDFWNRIVDFEALAAAGMIDRRDLDLIRFVSSAEEAWTVVERFYADNPEPIWHRSGPAGWADGNKT